MSETSESRRTLAEARVRVRYAETDQMGVVWHGNYILYFEAARTEALRACGGSYRELEARGVKTLALRVDVTSEASLAEAAAAVASGLGPVHVLSNNAGVSAPQGKLADKTDADWQWVFSVNLFGIVKSVQAFLPGLRSHGQGGHIVNTSSMAVLL